MEREKESPVSKVVKLKEELKAAKLQIEELSGRVEELQKEVDEAKQANLEMQAKYERLKLARAYGWDEESKANATKRISAIVREIDSCLALLKKID